jgi:anti-sigma regulatory factor (Ser/Thr protein kinase)
MKAIHGQNLAGWRQERLQTAVAETVMNAIEHGNQNLADMPVSIEVLTINDKLCVRITDHGGTHPIPEPQAPDLAAKLTGQQSPRGWGLFLIRNMVDEMHVTNDDAYHTVELVFHVDGGQDAGKSI